MSGNVTLMPVPAPVNERPLDDGGYFTPAWVQYFQRVGDTAVTPAQMTAARTSAAAALTAATAAQTAVGHIGAYVSATVLPGAAVPLTSSVTANVASISLPPGDWDVSGNVGFNAAGTTVTGIAAASISDTSASLPGVPGAGAYSQVASGNTAGAITLLPTGGARFVLTVATTLYLVANAGFTVSTMAAFGFIGARRMG